MCGDSVADFKQVNRLDRRKVDVRHQMPQSDGIAALQEIRHKRGQLVLVHPRRVGAGLIFDGAAVLRTAQHGMATRYPHLVRVVIGQIDVRRGVFGHTPAHDQFALALHHDRRLITRYQHGQRFRRHIDLGHVREARRGGRACNLDFGHPHRFDQFGIAPLAARQFRVIFVVAVGTDDFLRLRLG